MASKFSHNKKRDSALLYEFLVRHISACLVAGKKDEAKKALSISKKHFAAGTPLHGELCLFKSLLDTRVKSRHSAQKIIDTVCKKAALTNVRTLDVAKSKVIKEINHVLKDRNFYNVKITGYVVYASAQALLNESRNKKRVLSDVQRIKLEDVLCEHMVTPQERVLSPLSRNPNYSNVIYRLVVEKFNNKYDQKLSKGQRGLLMNYATFLISGDDKILKESLLIEVRKVSDKLRKVKDSKVQEDKDLMSKIHECYKKTLMFEIGPVNDDVTLEVLRYMQLADEVES